MVQQICGQNGQNRCADGFGPKICTVLFSKTEKKVGKLQSNPGVASGASESLSIHLCQ